ncbi:MAG: flavin reductase family protein [Thermoproteota archaeon]|jgi:flavin reductase (DIM6/NTAB) family NADH-FMN oxidoreductase RutF|nr:flavin reductase family protein [Thermoproteota archaeon]
MIDRSQFREIMSYFATGVTIVAVNINSKPYGLTVNSFTSVSLEPPLILICIQKGKKAHDMISRAKFFSINILTSEQEHLSVRFADPKIEDIRFEGVDYEIDEYGCPLIKNCLAYIICRKYKEYDGGDHTIFLGEIVEMIKGQEKLPLIFFKRNYYTIKI